MTQGFWNNYALVGECWEWTSNRNAKGYGRWGKRRRLAHRVAYELAVGPIPLGMLVCHTCDNPPCIRPQHLWVGTNRDNVQDRIKKGRPGSTGRPRKFRKHATLTHNQEESK